MKMISLLIACSLILPEDEKERKLQEKVDLGQMRGSWKRISTESGGITRKLAEPVYLAVSDNEFTFGTNSDTETVILDPTRSPKAIDLTPTGDSAGPLKGKTYPGIYRIEGDTFVLCLSIKPGSERPTAFDTTKSTLLIIDVYERSKPPASK